MNKRLLLIALLITALLTGLYFETKDSLSPPEAGATTVETDTANVDTAEKNSDDNASSHTEAEGKLDDKPITKARSWAQDLSDIKADSKTVYGTLDNGLRYIIHKNALPPKRASFRLHVNAGSLSEKDSQRGLAHFLEHMVFNGTETFPDATKLIPQMQRLGISFGAHANAYTSFDETVYMLDLPNVDKSTLELAYNVMGDFAGGALLEEDEIKEEHGVISSEKTSSDSIQRRMMEKQFKQLMPKSRLAERFPIGTDETLAGLTREDFTDFYGHYYTPQKMTFIVVGDIDVEEVKQHIVDTFGAMKNPEKQGDLGSVGDISSAKGLQAAVFADEELSATDLSLMSIRSKEREIDTVANRAKKIPLSIAHSIINRRFRKLAKKEDSVITSGSISASVYFRDVEIGSVDVTAKNDNWQAAVPVMEQELRQALEYGFTEAEFKEVVADLVNSYEQSVLSASTRKSPSLASSLARHIHKDYVFSTPEDDLAIFKKNIASITPETCHKALVDFWNTEDFNLILSTKKEPENAKKTLLSLFNKSKEVAVKPPVQKEVGEFAYTHFGEAGEVVSNKHIEDLDFHQIQFSNGVKVNYKKTDFDKNRIILTAHFGTGLLRQPKDKPGVEMLASSVVNGGGFGKHSADDLVTILAGKNVGVSFGIGNESFSLDGSTTPEDLELQLQLMGAMLMDAGYRPEAERQFKSSLPMLYSRIKHSAQGAQIEMDEWMNGGDPRFVFPSEAQAMALTTDDVKQWIDPQLKHSALEVGIVGDFDEKTLISLLAKTLGALPKRDEAVVIDDAEREITIPNTPVTKAFHYESKVEKALAYVHWKAEDNREHNPKLLRRASILAAILNDRLRVKLREELGESYSPGAGSDLSETYNNVGFIIAYSSVKPKDLDHVSKVVVGIGENLAKNGITDDELNRALTPRFGTLKRSKRQNSYWLDTVIGESQTQTYRIDWARGRDADYKSINKEDIDTLAKKYLTADRSLSVKISPKGADEVKVTLKPGSVTSLQHSE